MANNQLMDRGVEPRPTREIPQPCCGGACPCVMASDREFFTEELRAEEQSHSKTASSLIEVKHELESMTTQLESTQKKLASATSELGTASSTLSSTQLELSTAASKLVETEGTLISTQKELGETREMLRMTKASLVEAQEELQTTATLANSLNEELRSCRNDLSGRKREHAETRWNLGAGTKKLEAVNKRLGALSKLGFAHCLLSYQCEHHHAFRPSCW